MTAIPDLKPPAASPFPAMTRQEGVAVPEAPRDLAALGIDRDVLAELALKTAHSVPRCNTKWVAGQMRLPVPLAEELLEGLANDYQLDVVGQEGPFNRRYSVSGRGHERARRLMSVSG
jgi:hypothetical protein